MTEPPDHHELARRYLDLWQEQISGAAGDPAVADAMARMMAGWQSVMGQTFGQQPPGHGEGEGDGATGRNGDTGAGAAGPAAASAASGGADDVIRQLLMRIADLEKRVEQLERSGKRK